VGAVAICGLPPLNGFVSEFLIFLGLFGTLDSTARPFVAGAALAAPALALIGALALACFVKVYGATFLGTGRSAQVQNARESPMSMLGPMGILAVCCVVIGLAPVLVAPLLGEAVAAWAPEVFDAGPRLAALAPLGWITVMGVLLLAALLAVAIALQVRLGARPLQAGVTWGCGYVQPTPRMQYTSSSFAQLLVGLFRWVLRPHTSKPADLPIFPEKARFHSDVPDAVLDEAVLPTFRFWAWLFSWCRVLQQGSIQSYLLYIVVVLILLLMASQVRLRP
jgi:hydrogenase-4 component B